MYSGCVGRILVCLFHFNFCVILSTMMILMLWCEKTRRSYGTAKECSLPGGWMEEWMGWWVHEWFLLSPQARAETGAGHLSDHCCFVVSVSCVLSSFTGEKEGLLQKPCRHEDSPVLFCHILPLFWKSPFNPSSFSPFPLWSYSRAVGTTQCPFLRVFIRFWTKQCRGKKTRWCLNEN